MMKSSWWGSGSSTEEHILQQCSNMKAPGNCRGIIDNSVCKLLYSVELKAGVQRSQGDGGGSIVSRAEPLGINFIADSPSTVQTHVLRRRKLH